MAKKRVVVTKNNTHALIKAVSKKQRLLSGLKKTKKQRKLFLQSCNQALFQKYFFFNRRRLQKNKMWSYFTSLPTIIKKKKHSPWKRKKKAKIVYFGDLKSKIKTRATFMLPRKNKKRKRAAVFKRISFFTVRFLRKHQQNLRWTTSLKHRAVRRFWPVVTKKPNKEQSTATSKKKKSTKSLSNLQPVFSWNYDKAKASAASKCFLCDWCAQKDSQSKARTLKRKQSIRSK